MTLAEGIPLGALAVTIIGLLLNSARQGGRVETKIDTALDVLHDHENRLRDIEGKPRLDRPLHSKPLHQQPVV